MDEALNTTPGATPGTALDTATRSQVVGVIEMPNGGPLTISVEACGNDAPDTVTVSGYATLMYLDPGTAVGRAVIEGLRAHLGEALAMHDAAVERIYAELVVGNYCPDIRLPLDVIEGHPGEERCPHELGENRTHRCDRVPHVDGHHVAISENHMVLAVEHVVVL